MRPGEGAVVVARDGERAGGYVEKGAKVVKEEGACVDAEEFSAVGGGTVAGAESGANDFSQMGGMRGGPCRGRKDPGSSTGGRAGTAVGAEVTCVRFYGFYEGGEGSGKGGVFPEPRL